MYASVKSVFAFWGSSSEGAKSKDRLYTSNIIRHHERIGLPKPDHVGLKALKDGNDIVILPEGKGYDHQNAIYSSGFTLT